VGACRVAACAAAGSWPLRRTQISRRDTRESHEHKRAQAEDEAGTKGLMFTETLTGTRTLVLVRVALPYAISLVREAKLGGGEMERSASLV